MSAPPFVLSEVEGQKGGITKVYFFPFMVRSFNRAQDFTTNGKLISYLLSGTFIESDTVMENLIDATHQAIVLLLSGNSELWCIIGISFRVSITAILIATVPALLTAFALSHWQFPGRRLLITLFSTFLSIPAVVVGLTLYILLSRQGALGDWKLLFTQSAMVMGQIALCFPILVAMGHTALQSAERNAWETARTLGAGSFRALYLVMREVRFGLLAALLAAFGRIIAEVGSSMMLGGNILNYTRNIPTAIALETSRGEFSQGIALGLVLLIMAFSLNAMLHQLQGRGQPVL